MLEALAERYDSVLRLDPRWLNGWASRDELKADAQRLLKSVPGEDVRRAAERLIVEAEMLEAGKDPDVRWER